jgi:hypothetical protein
MSEGTPWRRFWPYRRRRRLGRLSDHILLATGLRPTQFRPPPRLIDSIRYRVVLVVHPELPHDKLRCDYATTARSDATRGVFECILVYRICQRHVGTGRIWWGQQARRTSESSSERTGRVRQQLQPLYTDSKIMSCWVPSGRRNKRVSRYCRRSTRCDNGAAAKERERVDRERMCKTEQIHSDSG